MPDCISLFALAARKLRATFVSWFPAFLKSPLRRVLVFVLISYCFCNKHRMAFPIPVDGPTTR